MFSLAILFSVMLIPFWAKKSFKLTEADPTPAVTINFPPEPINLFKKLTSSGERSTASGKKIIFNPMSSTSVSLDKLHKNCVSK